MRKGFKVFIVIILICIIAIAAFWAYLHFVNSENRNAFSIIPEDAVYIIETRNLSKGWQTISDSKIWKHLTSTEYFREINESAGSLDSLIRGNKTLELILRDRQLLISMHMTSGISYDFIFTVDLKKTSKISFIKNYLKEIARLFDYELNRKRFKGTEIIDLRSLETNETLFITFIDNLLVCTYSEVLIENAIMQKDQKGWIENNNFQEVAGNINDRKLFSFYFNMETLQRYMRLFLSEESDIVNSISKSLGYAAFNFNIENEKLLFEGYTSLNDKMSSYLKALSKVEPAKTRAYEITTDKTAIYISLCFESFENFFKNLEIEFSVTNEEGYESYSKRVRRIEKTFKIDLDTDFFGWIGNEITFIKTRPTANAREQDVVVVMHSNDIEAAKTGLGHMTRQIQKKLPIKFESVPYLNFEINYLNIKGFFKLFFGKLFAGLEKPYFTYIEDYVVFSNSPTILMDFIDDYIKGNTLSHKKDFTDFKDEFDVKSNIAIFIQTPKLYSHLYYYSKNEKKVQIQENKDIIISFAQIGFQMLSDGNKFKTNLVAAFNENTLINEEMEKFEAAAEELYNGEYESLVFKVQVSDELIVKSGPFRIYHQDSTLKCEGKISDGNINGLVRSYYPSKNIMSSVNYVNGKVDGKALFYYDTESNIIKAEVEFKNDIIINMYREYYENAARKAMLTYEDGKANGEAEFYYESGVIKMKGTYKDGIKHGKWKHYTETGQLMDKEKWKKGTAI